MPRGSTDLDNYEYDEYLARNKKERELRSRYLERRNANKGVEGWHFGLDDKPFKTRDIHEFRHELEKRGLAIKDEYKGRR